MKRHFQIDSSKNFLFRVEYKPEDAPLRNMHIELSDGFYASELRLSIRVDVLTRAIRIGLENKDVFTRMEIAGIGSLSIANIETGDVMQCHELQPYIYTKAEDELALAAVMKVDGRDVVIPMTDNIPFPLVDFLTEF